jgi:hypothetical protein
MSAVELFHQDGHSAHVWYCDKCRHVADTKKKAEECCTGRLCSCGKPVRHYSIRCDECDSRDFKAKCEREENERFEKATKVSANDWTGDQCYYEDHYFESVEDFMEWAENNFVKWAENNFVNPSHYPNYIWQASNQGVRKADIEDVIANCVDSLWEGAGCDDLNGVAELQSAIDAFNKANESVTVWMVDYSTAIVLEGFKEIHANSR